MEISNQILSEITVHMKYAKYIDALRRRETFTELIDRNKEMHMRRFPELAEEIESAYKLVYEKKVLPSMRSLQFGGAPIELNPARMYNCCYTPVDDIAVFKEILFLLLGGTGVGFSVQRHHIEKLPELSKPTKSRRYVVADSIEGWADAVGMLMKAYFKGAPLPIFDFSQVRPKGARIITSGGKAPGPEPLRVCLERVKLILDNADTKLRPIEAHDIVCHLADAVLSGGIRRAALISLFSADDEEMLAAKSGPWWEKNPQRGRANNSASLLRGVDDHYFHSIMRAAQESGAGEPGIFWVNDRESGTNPCAEILLNPKQFCNLTEINVSSVVSQEDLNERTAAAAFIGTLQASYTDFHYLRPHWREITEKESLLGVSMTGIASMPDLDLTEASQIAVETNKRIAGIIGINPAARVTTVKPAGTTSLVLGCSSGIHAWHNGYYIRRIRVNKNEAIYSYFQVYHPELIEDEVFSPNTTAVISVPQKAPEGAILRTESELSLLERVKKVYHEWILPGHQYGASSHNVSATISVRPESWDEVIAWMWDNREYYNGLSVLPYDGGTYVQAPFEDITKEKYEELISSLTSVDLTKVIELDDNTTLMDQAACAGGACEVK